MALRRDRNGNVTSESFISEAQDEARQLRKRRKQDKINKCEENRAARLRRSPEEQLALLDERLGKDVGATKERARLKKQIEKSA